MMSFHSGLTGKAATAEKPGRFFKCITHHIAVSYELPDIIFCSLFLYFSNDVIVITP